MVLLCIFSSLLILFILIFVLSYIYHKRTIRKIEKRNLYVRRKLSHINNKIVERRLNFEQANK